MTFTNVSADVNDVEGIWDCFWVIKTIVAAVIVVSRFHEKIFTFMKLCLKISKFELLLEIET